MNYYVQVRLPEGKWQRSIKSRTSGVFTDYRSAQKAAELAESRSSFKLEYRVIPPLPLKKCPWWKPHYMLPSGTRNVVTPEAGPFDPRTEEERTTKVQMEICAHCGETRKYEDTYDGY